MIKGIVGIGKVGLSASVLAMLGLGGAFLYGSLGSSREYNTDQIIEKEALTRESEAEEEQKRKPGEPDYVSLEKVKVYKVSLRGRESPTYLIEDLETNRRYWIKREHGELFINGYDGIARRLVGNAREIVEPIFEKAKPYAKQAAREGLESVKRSLDREIDPDTWID